jgi:hypothetical protein
MSSTEQVARLRGPLVRALTLLVALVTAVFMASVTTADAKPKGSTSVPVTGTAAFGDPFQGILDVSWFQVKNGQLMAPGTLTGTVTDAVTGAEVARVSEPVAVPVDRQQSAGECQVLNLVLAPLHLDLLGLVIDLNQVVLTITAVPGAGNLLNRILGAVG